ncbi:MAG: HPr family phosphocarrier protein [Syntrophaceae bacterium]|nr:HPr family phosphocarrier protein [Syntrophaceae bacterium]
MQAIRTFEIANRLGIHARAAARLVETANRYQAEISLMKDSHEVSGRSILDILTLACPQGHHLTVRAEGEDAAEAMEALAQLIEGKFGED